MPRVPKSREWMMTHGLLAMSPEERRAAQSRGGKKTAENLRRRKSMVEMAKTVLGMELQGEEEIRRALRLGGLDREDITYAAGIVMAQAQKAMGGDTKAAEFLRDTSGQKPADSLVVGNLDDKPFETIDLTALTDSELRILVAVKEEELEEDCDEDDEEE